MNYRRVKNAIKYYYDLEQRFIELKKENDKMDKTFKYNKIKLEACHNVIKDFTEKNERMKKLFKEKLNINFSNIIKFK